MLTINRRKHSTDHPSLREAFRKRTRIISGAVVLVLCYLLASTLYFGNGTGVTPQHAVVTKPAVFSPAAERALQAFDSWQNLVRLGEAALTPPDLPRVCEDYEMLAKLYTLFAEDNDRRVTSQVSRDVIDVTAYAASNQVRILQQWDRERRNPAGKRALFVTTRHSLDTHADRWFFQLFHDVGELDDWSAYIWGPGLPGYNDRHSLALNLEFNFPYSIDFDFILFMYSYTISRPEEEFTQAYIEENFHGRPVVGCLLHEIWQKDVAEARRCFQLHVTFNPYLGYLFGPGIYISTRTLLRRCSMGSSFCYLPHVRFTLTLDFCATVILAGSQILPRHPANLLHLSPHAVPSFIFDEGRDSMRGVARCTLPVAQRSTDLLARDISFLFIGMLASFTSSLLVISRGLPDCVSSTRMNPDSGHDT